MRKERSLAYEKGKESGLREEKGAWLMRRERSLAYEKGKESGL